MSTEVRLVPGRGFLIETGSEVRLLPGFGFVKESAGGSSPTNITLGQASWLWTGRAPSVNAQTGIALARGAWAWTGRAMTVNAQTGISLARATWQWFGIPLQGAASAVQNLMLFFGIGS